MHAARSYILTEDDRRRLRNWLETGEEDKTLKNLFTKMRRSLPTLRDDMLLIIGARKRLRAERRWKRRLRNPRGFGSPSPLDESG
ncbi:hypothetical protein KAV46_01685 [Candidatus Bathyarchaeota archaeon]|nr:hypothetical protein [Candidatus Bathyarchaeota archaeon]